MHRKKVIPHRGRLVEVWVDHGPGGCKEYTPRPNDTLLRQQTTARAVEPLSSKERK